MSLASEAKNRESLQKWGKLALRGVFFVAVIATLFVLSYYAARKFFPLQFGRWVSELELSRAGVEEIEAEAVVAGRSQQLKLAGYLRDYCESASSVTKTAGERANTCSCLVLLHGVGDSALTWKNILLQPKSEWFLPVRLYAWDLPGVGDSPVPPSNTDYRARFQAQAVTAAMKSVAPSCDRWIVVGNSMGGWIAAWMAVDAASEVQKLILVDSLGLKFQATTTQGLLEPTVESMKDFQQKAYHRPRELPEEVWAASARAIQESNVAEVKAAQTEDDFLDPVLSQIKKPTVVFWGESDRITTPQEGRELARRIPGAIFREAKECGHMPQKECPLALLKLMNEMLLYGSM